MTDQLTTQDVAKLAGITPASRRESKSSRLVIQLEPELKRAFHNKCLLRGEEMSEWVREAIRNWLGSIQAMPDACGVCRKDLRPDWVEYYGPSGLVKVHPECRP